MCFAFPAQVLGGLLDEAAMLLEAGVAPGSSTASRAIGYRQTMDMLVQVCMYRPYCLNSCVVPVLPDDGHAGTGTSVPPTPGVLPTLAVQPARVDLACCSFHRLLTCMACHATLQAVACSTPLLCAVSSNPAPAPHTLGTAAWTVGPDT
jgi:hypothetical protein